MSDAYCSHVKQGDDVLAGSLSRESASSSLGVIPSGIHRYVG